MTDRSPTAESGRTAAGTVIVGGGLAGAKAAQALREAGYTGPVTLVSREADPPYQRPPLSKSYLAGATGFAQALVHPLQWYLDNSIDLRRSTTATALDPAAHTLTLNDGTTLSYAKLLLATGSTPRRLTIPNAGAANVHYLRTHTDADRIRGTFGPGRRLVIVGAGWIGLEVAAAAREAGTDVTVLESAHVPLLAVLGPKLGQVFADLHTAHGVQLRLATVINGFLSDGHQVSGVRLADGSTIQGDAVVVGIGVTPNLTLAEAAGLATDNGVLVDATLRTSDPDIYAVGDIANHDHPTLHTRVRVEHWATALNQPAAAVAAMLGSTNNASHYTDLPYFFTDQYDLGMEYLGYVPPGTDTHIVIRGNIATLEFVAFWLDNTNRMKAAMNVNIWDVPDQIKPLINNRTVIDLARLADPNIDYTHVAAEDHY